ncbi:MAG TPA: hypothetical protein VJS43_10420 [Candidatus Acidoferrales bacterium]|nr:hypothetical protein [Candidatus Acidoferrales bacterium]
MIPAPYLPITIYVKELDVHKTTSFIAAGQFETGICEEYEIEEERKILAELRRSRNRIIEIQSSSPHNRYGIALRRDYTLSCAIKWLQRWRHHGRCAPKPGSGSRSVLASWSGLLVYAMTDRGPLSCTVRAPWRTVIFVAGQFY